MEKHPDYIDQLNTYYNFILTPFVGKTHNGWEFDEEHMAGSFLWHKKFGDNEVYVYATPYWETIDGIAIQVSDDQGNIDEIRNIPLPNVTGDSKKDSDVYFNIMKSELHVLDFKLENAFF